MKTNESGDFKYQSYSLRKPETKDASGLISISNDPSVMEYYGVEGSYLESEDQALKQISWMKKTFDKAPGRWVIAESGSDQYLGDIGFFNYDNDHRKIELGFKLKKEYWGRGIISSFLRPLVEYAFQEVPVNRIEAYIDERNAGSMRVVLKNGFHYEGTLWECEFEYGRFVTLELYSLLRSDLLQSGPVR
jgi:ribosomal-protein-alanine N-acetyltransferase